MDAEKPFKTIEVVDSRTNQVCKVACMSCIRGHRTTSCGIPVCRSKIFWTVKRPGRPSNSCTCRYGATGGCKCVVARSACPHKSKKGEKRSGECRCDEQGRYCCLLEPEHWNSLLSLEKPTVDFFPTTEALRAKQDATSASTPSYSSIASPPSTHSIPSTPTPQGRMQPLHIMPQPYNSYQPIPSTTLTPRFGMMGIAAPMGSPHDVAPDVLAWEGPVPQAPREHMYHRPQQHVYEPLEQSSCCQASTPSAHTVQSSAPQMEHSFSQQHQGQDARLSPQHYTNVAPAASMSQLSPQPPAFDWNKMQNDYFRYQFPGAICQNCGLNGCTCRNCPPVFQHPGTTSWAQCCGRKHARDVQPTPIAQKVLRTEDSRDTAQARQSQPGHRDAPSSSCCQSAPQQTFVQDAPFEVDATHFGEGFHDLELLSPHGDANFLGELDMARDMLLPDATAPLDLSDFLLSDLDRSDPVHGSAPPNNETGASAAATDEGGGGCCDNERGRCS
ncbi:hypothetical protein AC579_1097 [Lecanosticta acicola]|uniref:Copper-fist domain-containing protein n=1 Tax=Lecanosticta acicola TaxID=111012 RepID=A0AAI8Z4U8_9PEZI|nr:hypothetical protein AC579_1097 [Lecanosticta acicola]